MSNQGDIGQVLATAVEVLLLVDEVEAESPSDAELVILVQMRLRAEHLICLLDDPRPGPEWPFQIKSILDQLAEGMERYSGMLDDRPGQG